jgi:uncharacterized protein (DUF2235 family)
MKGYKTIIPTTPSSSFKNLSICFDGVRALLIGKHHFSRGKVLLLDSLRR